jgi:hypothetical protein
MNLYVKLTCDFCGDRLPWADTFAATSGENCPHCHKFNSYIHANCASCDERLPWADAAAPRRAANGHVETEQKSFALVILICAIAFMLFMGFMFYSLAQAQ